VVIILVFKHKTGSLGPAYLTINDMRLYEIMKLYVRYVRIRLLKQNKKWKKMLHDMVPML
jgi:hypothetical protein